MPGPFDPQRKALIDVLAAKEKPLGPNPVREALKLSSPYGYLADLFANSGNVWERYKEHNKAGVDQANLGAQQVQEGNLPQGIPNMMLGGAGWLGSPISALAAPALDPILQPVGGAVNEYVGKPIEGMTGYPSELSTQLAMAMIPGKRGAMKPRGLAEMAAPEGITAYHGSPHTFDKFDMSKMGTGEGAQAYGHGLYFAENPTVAGYYREGLTKDRTLEFKGKPVKEIKHDGGTAQDDALAQAHLYGGADAAIAEIKKGVASMTRAGVSPDNPQLVRDSQRLAFLEANKDHITIKPGGATYEVRLNVKPDELLDWDRPLSEQSEAIRNFVNKNPKAAAAAESFRDAFNEVPTGRHLMAAAKHESGKSPAKAAASLKAAGIKGVRYKDAGSRSGEGGTYNYVIFDDKIIDILKRYGVAMTAGAGGAAIVAGQNMPPEVASQLGPQG